MQIETAKLEGAALDWVVAELEGEALSAVTKGYVTGKGRPAGKYSPSTDWAQGGPIIEREKICFSISTVEGWKAAKWNLDFGNESIQYAPTPLIAAMRCYVASLLGIEVEVYEEH